MLLWSLLMLFFEILQDTLLDALCGSFNTSATCDQPFENKWTRSSPTTATATPSSRRSDNQPQTTNHE